MKTFTAYTVLTVAVLYSLFLLTLIFVATFTTLTVIPADPHNSKALGFGFFSFFFVGALWFAGLYLVTQLNDSKQSK